MVVILKKQRIVVICILAVTYEKRCIGFGCARTFGCTLAGDGEPVTMVLKATSTVIHWLSGKAPQAMLIWPYVVMGVVYILLVFP